MMNTNEAYGSVAKWLHWVGALLIIGMLTLGTVMSFVTDKVLRSDLIGIHKSIGLILLIFILFRWIWRRINIKPDFTTMLSNSHKKAVHFFHEFLYVAIFIMLLSGIIMTAAHHRVIPFFGWFTITFEWFPKSNSIHNFFNWTHLIFAWTLGVLLTGHIFAALTPHFWHSDNTLNRMLPKKR